MSLFRPAIERIDGYTPGEQPQETGWTKLNTNENPYPPSPAVAEAVEAAARGNLRIYPDPLARKFCKVVADLFGVDPEWVLPANGSDENLTIITRSFADAGQIVSFPYPSYILYETLADIQGAQHRRLLLNEDWSWDFNRIQPDVDASRLIFVPNPNSPSGNRWSQSDILRLVPPRGVLVLDEAYGDFPDEPHRGEILQEPAGRQIVVTRTLSKSYSLAGIRMGFAIAHPDLITGMRKVKDSYNCNTLSLAAATAALQDQAWMLKNTASIRATRARLTDALRQLGLNAVTSHSNFVWATHPDRDHRSIYEELKKRRILIRYMRYENSLGDRTVDGLRITVGTDAEIDQFLSVLSDILG